MATGKHRTTRQVRKKTPRRSPSRLKRALKSLVLKARSLLEGDGAGRWRSAGGVVVRRGTIAMVRQKKKWSFPKGRVDPGENLSRAARREVLEETGLDAQVIEYLGVVVGARKETHWFLMELRSEGGPTDGEIDEVRFVKPARARQLLKKKDRPVLDRAERCWAGQPLGPDRIGD
ncbi:MAG: NUDIX domain-containing protein [Myxococcaceae bacterium]